MKTIAAFANTKGGDLLIGVSDDGEIIGIEVDNYKNKDEFVRAITKEIENKLSPNPMLIPELLSITHKVIDSKTICRVKVKSADRPLYTHYEGDEKFYTRKTASSESLSLRDSLRYIRSRFKNYYKNQ